METLLKRGQVVVARAMQSACVVQELLGEGAQAEVYRARIGSFDYALKWYRPEYLQGDPRLWDRLKEAVNTGSPAEQYLWPFDLVSMPGSTAYGGYVMPIKPPHFVSLVELLWRRCEPTFRALTNVGFQLAHNFFRLHALGLCYRDINFGNIFFDPATGDILIGDTDNVDVNRRPGSVLGTSGFMAPEVGRREALPSAMTDRYSLAVLLFNVFMLGHPLKGRRETELHYDATDPDGSRRLCADHPVFVFDPIDQSNAPVAGLHDVMVNFWRIYPQSMRDLFTRSFTVGLRDPDGRVMENEWRREMIRMRDSIFHCPSCGAENFFDLASVRHNRNLSSCWSCAAPQAMPPRIRLTRNGQGADPSVVVLAPTSPLFPHHLEGDDYNFGSALAVVEGSGSLCVLRNLSGRPWTSRSIEGELSQTPPGSAVLLRNGCRVHFGACDGEIRM
jgi:serine/threonine protein kinase